MVGVVLVLAWKVVIESPKTPLLLPENRAIWIKLDLEPDIGIGQSRSNRVIFRKTFELPGTIQSAPATIKGFRSFRVFVDDAEIAGIEPPRIPWMDETVFDLAKRARPGLNFLYVEAMNDAGHPAVLFHCEALDLRTDLSWEVSLGGDSWQPVAAAAEKRQPAISEQFPGSFSALASVFPVFFAVMLFVAGCLMLRDSHPLLRRVAQHSIWKPGRFRFVVMLAWTVLCLNNLVKLPLFTGFDAEPHVDYIKLIANQWTLPLADDGWQCFQAPLYYAIAAVWLTLVSVVFDPEASLRLLDVIPLICGLVQIEFLHRSLRLLHCGDAKTINVSLLAGAFLPMHVYISQAGGNEPLAGALTAALVFVTLRQWSFPADGTLPQFAWRAGLLFGAAILAKVTAVLLLPIMLGMIALATRRDGGDLRKGLSANGAFVLAAIMVCGWYFARNWLRFGKPFVGGWENDDFFYWQDPTFRTPSDFYTFGAAISSPIFASFHGFWDGLYSSFWLDGYLSLNSLGEGQAGWNMTYMLALAPLSLPLCAIGFAGWMLGLRSADAGIRRSVQFLTFCLAAYLAGMLFLFLRAPNFSTVKATYMTGLLPCFAVLFSLGFQRLAKGQKRFGAATGFVCAWAATVYIAFLS